MGVNFAKWRWCTAVQYARTAVQYFAGVAIPPPRWRPAAAARAPRTYVYPRQAGNSPRYRAKQARRGLGGRATGCLLGLVGWASFAGKIMYS
jgi:hypothetical protein